MAVTTTPHLLHQTVTSHPVWQLGGTATATTIYLPPQKPPRNPPPGTSTSRPQKPISTSAQSGTRRDTPVATSYGLPRPIQSIPHHSLPHRPTQFHVPPPAPMSVTVQHQPTPSGPTGRSRPSTEPIDIPRPRPRPRPKSAPS